MLIVLPASVGGEHARVDADKHDVQAFPEVVRKGPFGHLLLGHAVELVGPRGPPLVGPRGAGLLLRIGGVVGDLWLHVAHPGPTHGPRVVVAHVVFGNLHTVSVLVGVSPWTHHVVRPLHAWSWAGCSRGHTVPVQWKHTSWGPRGHWPWPRGLARTHEMHVVIGRGGVAVHPTARWGGRARPWGHALLGHTRMGGVVLLLHGGQVAIGGL